MQGREMIRDIGCYIAKGLQGSFAAVAVSAHCQLCSPQRAGVVALAGLGSQGRAGTDSLRLPACPDHLPPLAACWFWLLQLREEMMGPALVRGLVDLMLLEREDDWVAAIVQGGYGCGVVGLLLWGGWAGGSVQGDVTNCGRPCAVCVSCPALRCPSQPASSEPA